MKLMMDLIQRHKAGHRTGVVSVCSAHPLVIEATLRSAMYYDAPALIESTSNQVNQFGGYTGMQPADFMQFVRDIAARLAFPGERLLFGGDHLGPNCWQNETAEQALLKSEQLIRSYVLAGFKKIHLDCSMSCADDPTPLTDQTVATRAARLCAVAEQAWLDSGGEAPVYVIGTEVPVPGGAHEELGSLQVTSPKAAAATILAHQQAFAALPGVWDRVIGLVVQPGVEFDHHKVIDYHSGQARSLSQFIETQPHMVYEAHSTDYQSADNLSRLVRDHFAILKVGPAVTFALREALWALADIESELVEPERGSQFKRVVLDVLQSDPTHWSKYYTSPTSQKLDLQFSLSDRIRYYWPHPEIRRAEKIMFDNLEAQPVPLTLLSQYLPNQYQAVRAGRLASRPRELLIAKIMTVLDQYGLACYGIGDTL